VDLKRSFKSAVIVKIEVITLKTFGMELFKDRVLLPQISTKPVGIETSF